MDDMIRRCWTRFQADRARGFDWTPDNYNCKIRDIGGKGHCPVADECREFMDACEGEAAEVARVETEYYVRWWTKAMGERNRTKILSFPGI